MPEAANDAQDIYCGKCQQAGFFDRFMNYTKQKLIEQKVINNNTDNHALIIAGYWCIKGFSTNNDADQYSYKRNNTFRYHQRL